MTALVRAAAIGAAAGAGVVATAAFTLRLYVGQLPIIHDDEVWVRWPNTPFGPGAILGIVAMLGIVAILAKWNWQRWFERNAR